MSVFVRRQDRSQRIPHGEEKWIKKGPVGAVRYERRVWIGRDRRAYLSANARSAKKVVLRRLVQHLGVDEVARRLALMIPGHQSLTVFFSAGCRENHAECYQAIENYFAALRVEVGAALLLHP